MQRASETRTLKAQVEAIETGATGGATVRELAGANFQDVERSGLPGPNRAVLVTAVKPGSQAFQHGLRTGDLIIGVNGRRVTSLKEIASALRGRNVQLNVVRGDNVLTIPVS